jgi:predicted amidohydrolase YtcJ
MQIRLRVARRVARHVALCLALPVAPVTAQSTSLIIVNARVWTGSRTRPWADAVAVRDDRLAVVGTSAEAMKLATPTTRVIDAKGRMVTPGFLDSHVHFVDGGYDLTAVQLRDAATPADFIERIKTFAATLPPGAWMLGGTWDETRWGPSVGLPTRAWIDSVTPHTPVWIERLDGHEGLANSAALRAANITRDTPDVPGGTIVRDASGEPTGILKDNAMAFVLRALPTPPPELQDRALDAAMAYANAQGVTAVTNMGAGWVDWAAFERAHAAGRLTTRIYSVVPLHDWARLRDTIAARGRGDAWLHWGGLKGFADGSLGSHTAAMLAPFTDTPHDSGLLVTPPAELYIWAKAADQAGLQVMVHAIGDRAIRNMLDIYERIAREDGPRDRRFRIEHAQHIAASDVPRFGALHVIASMQPYHAIDDGRWADPIIGPERARTTYAFRTLLDTHATIAFGSDWDVAPATPIEGIYAAVTRRTLDDKHPDGWVPAQKITVDEALHAYTTAAAYTAFAEHDLGTLAVGRPADLVLIDRDLTRIPPETIRDAHVDMTVVGGRIVYERK